MGIKYVFWDRDGTFYDHKHLDKKCGLYPGIKDLVSKIPAERQGIITNAPFPELFLNGLKMNEYFNPKLIYSADTEKVKVLDNLNHPFRKKIRLTGNYTKDDIILTEYIEKPSVYMFQEMLKITGARPEECLMIDDSWEGIMPAEVMGIKSIYLNGLEDTEKWGMSVKELHLHPTKTVRVGNIEELEKEVKCLGVF